MLDLDTVKVINDWDKEVNAEMRRLILEGVPPYYVANRARQIVSIRRSATTNKNQPALTMKKSGK